jgi:putative membrane protein
MKEIIFFIFTGIAIGGANVIPGFSGGTVALIAGIFERLVNSINKLDFTTFQYVISGKWKDALSRIDFKFLSFIAIGVFFGILTLSRLLSFLFEDYPVYVWSFFFGLTVYSIIFLLKKNGQLNIYRLFFLLFGFSVAFFVTFAYPMQANSSFMYLFLCGIFASSGMILPGLSGSYILVIMGNYSLILNAINTANFLVLFPVFLGIIIGFLLFTKFLSWLINHFYFIAISCLTGFVAGSLFNLWPWKVVSSTGYSWLIPSFFSIEFMIAVSVFLLGYLFIYLLERSVLKN